jgi:hypothetical protein
MTKTTKVTKLKKADVQAIMGDIVSALATIEEKYGVKIERGSASYTELSFKCPITVTVNDNDEVLAKKKTDFERMAKLYGVSGDGFNVEFKEGGKTMRVTGFNTRAPKYPIILEDSEGKSYKGVLSAYERRFPLDKK